MLTQLVFAILMLAATGGGQQPRGIDRVAWLQGCWRTGTPERLIEEYWTAPRGGSMLGVGRTVWGDSLVDHEFVVLRQQGTGLAYEAHPSGQTPAVFTAPTMSESVVVFENTAHDFPQRVGYRRAKADSLVAWVEGTLRGRTRRVEFAYARVPCPGGR